MPKFIPYSHDQSSIVVINFRDQLQPGTLEHAIHYLIHEKLDLSIFDYAYSNKDVSRPVAEAADTLGSSRLSMCSRSMCSRYESTTPLRYRIGISIEYP